MLVLLSSLALAAAPVATSVTAHTTAGASVAITLHAFDIDGDAITYRIDTRPGHGAASFSGARVVYTPSSASWTGTDTFTYSVTDSTGARSHEATVTVTVR